MKKYIATTLLLLVHLTLSAIKPTKIFDLEKHSNIFETDFTEYSQQKIAITNGTRIPLKMKIFFSIRDKKTNKLLTFEAQEKIDKRIKKYFNFSTGKLENLKIIFEGNTKNIYTTNKKRYKQRN